MIRALGNKILFTFNDTVSQNRFSNMTETGIIYKSTEDTMNQPRWGTVVSIGGQVRENIKVGDVVLVDALRWTEELKTPSEAGVWATSEDDILLIKDPD